MINDNWALFFCFNAEAFICSAFFASNIFSVYSAVFFSSACVHVLQRFLFHFWKIRNRLHHLEWRKNFGNKDWCYILRDERRVNDFTIRTKYQTLKMPVRTEQCMCNKIRSKYVVTLLSKKKEHTHHVVFIY